MTNSTEFEAFYKKQQGSVQFVCDEYGSITHVVKRIDPQLKEVYEYLIGVHSPNLAVIFEVTEEDGSVLVYQEYISGRCVRENWGRMSDEELFGLAKDVANALQVIHSLQPPIIHRDIKPANIIKRDNGGFVLVDFDAGRVLKSGADSDTHVMGTVGYAAPEQFGLRQSDARSDIFSLGATLFWLKTGKPVNEHSRCPGRLKKIVKKCTRLDPAKRYRNAEELLRALNREQKRVPFRPIRVLSAAMACLLAFVCGAMSIKCMQQRVDTAYADCTCRFVVTDVLPHEEQVQLYRPGDEPVELQMRVRGYMDPSGCTAQRHRTAEMAVLRDARLGTSSQGTHARVDRSGHMLLEGNGVYAVDAGVFFGSEMVALVSETIVLTQRPQNYERCTCEIEQRKSGMAIVGDFTLPEGGVVQLSLEPNPVFDTDGCAASMHAELYHGGSWIEEAPEGADCAIEGGSVFRTDTAGVYVIRSEYFFGLQTFSCRDVIVIDREA